MVDLYKKTTVIQVFFSRYLRFIVWLIIIVLHSSYIFNGFAWLDHGDIELGRVIIPVERWYEIPFIRLGETGFYRPLVTLVHNIDYLLYGLRPWGFHITNILFYMGTVAIVPSFLTVFFQLSKKEKLIGQFIFGISPAHWLVVGAISYRQEIMYVFFTLCAVCVYTNRRMSFFWKSFAFVFFTFAAFFSKETAIVLLPSILLIWELSGKRWGRMFDRRRWMYIVLGVFAGIAYFLLRRIAVPEVWSIVYPSLTISEHIGTRIVLTVRLMLQLFSPFLPTLSDRIIVYTLLQFLPSIIIVCILIGLSLYKKYDHPQKWLLISLIVITILPGLHIVPTPRYFSSHYLYCASVFFPLIFIWLFRVQNILLRSVSFGLATCWVLIAICSTFIGGFRFKNDLSLFLYEVKHDDAFREGHQYLGDYYYFSQGQHNRDKRDLLLQKAVFFYKKALKQDEKMLAFVDQNSVINNLAGAYAQQGKFDEADQLLAELQKSFPTNKLVRYNRAMIAYRQKKYQRVIDLVHKSYTKLDQVEIFAILIDSLQRQGRVNEAEEMIHFMKERFLLLPENMFGAGEGN